MPAGPLRFDATEVREVLRMIESESLDVRAVTMGVSLRDTAADDLERTCGRIYEKLMRAAERLVPTTKAVHDDFAVPITSTRLSVTPLALVTEAARVPRVVPAALALDRAARELGVDYVGGFSALVEKGITPGDRALIDSIPEALSETKHVCSSINVASTRAGINIDAVLEMGRVVKSVAEATAAAGGIGCARLVTFANIPDDNPFVAGALHGVGEGECVINVGCSGPGVVLSALKRLRAAGEPFDVATIAETIKRMAFKVTRAGELIGREVARRLGPPVRFGVVDLSLAPTPAVGDSVAEILEAMGIEKAGAPGSIAALALLTDAVKKGGVMASSAVGGLSGAFIPVSEDAGMVAAARAGALSIERLESMSAVCSVGLDMVAVPGDTTAETLAAIIADEIAIGVFNNKATGVRIIPVPGKQAGESVVYGGLLGEAYVQPVSRFRGDGFIRLGGRIPRAADGPAQLIPGRAVLVMAVLGAAPAATPPPAQPAAADKALAVRLEPFRFFAGAAPAGWNGPGFDDRAWGGPAPGPFAPRQPPQPGNMQPPAGVTNFDLAPGQPLLLRARFAVPEARRVRALELRVAYNDAFIAYVDGREVARRGLAPGATTAAAAPHGPEPERVYLGVPEDLPAVSAEGNLLAIAIYPHAGRNTVIPSAPAAAIGLAAASGVRIVRGPYLAAPAEIGRKAQVSVVWETDLPAIGEVVVAPAAGAGAATVSVPVHARTRRHVVAVPGLERGAAYRYHVTVEGGPGDRAASAPARFQTIAPPPAPVRFAVYGDMRYPGHDAHRSVVEALVREAPPLVISPGDLTDVGSEESNWQRYFDITAPLGAIAPIIPVLGNHDAARAGAGAPLTWSLFAMPTPAPPFWTSFELGGVHFVVLDTNDASNSAQREWLEADLARARRHRARGVFAFCHEAPWSHALHGNTHKMIRDYAPLLAAGHVDVLFCGHDHTYERGVGSTPAGNLVYINSGGGGAPLYNPRCQAVTGPLPGDVPGPLPPCPPTVAALVKTYHYILVTVADDAITLCTKRPDGSAVEPCVRLPPHRR